MDELPKSCRLSRYQGVLWSVSVEVRGRPRRFLLDFGAGVTCVDASLAEEFGLQEIDRVAGRRMSGERVEITLVEPVDMVVAGRALSPARLGRLDLARLLPRGWPPIDGALALDLFEDLHLRVDLARDRLELGGSRDTAGLEPVVARLHRQIPGVSLVCLLAVVTPTGELWFELDNSNTGPVVVSHAAAARMHVAPSAGQIAVEVRGLAPFLTPVVPADIIYDGNLGRSFVDGRTFVFDLATGRVWIGPPQPRPR